MRTEQIKEAITRGVENIYPTREALEIILRGEKKLRLYNGIDPTGPSLHVGHSVVLQKLKDFQDLGHKIILLIGDFTAMIGDPDKKATRVKQTREEVLNNCKNYVAQAGKILDLSKVELRYNSEWLSKMNFAEILELASNFTVQQMLERDLFQERIKDKEPIYLHEFFYPAMQAYDSLYLDVDLEVGGNDQTFNMLAGRTLMTKKGKEKKVLTMKLLVDPTGKKMGKTEGNIVNFDDTAENVYGKIMSQPDTLTPLFFECATRVATGEVEKILKLNPRDAKMRLAFEITKIYHGEAEAKKGERYFVNTIQNKETPINLKEIKVIKGESLSEILVKAKLVKSKGEFGRLVKENGVTVDRIKIINLFARAEKTCIVKIGKLRHLKIIV